MVRDLLLCAPYTSTSLYVTITLGPILSSSVVTADVYMKCSFAVQGLCVGAVVGGVSVWMRVHVCV